MILDKLFKKKSVANKKVIDVGWTLIDFPASVIWSDPEPFTRNLPKSTTAKSVQVCPAALDFDAGYFVVKCPIDLHIRFVIDQNGRPIVQNVDGEKSSVRDHFLNQLLMVVSPNEWRHPERPIIQVVTPYVFLSDDPVYINQFPPFLNYLPNQLPGLMISGRFPIDVWPRQMTWAFEWYDTNKEINIKRGDPWFYVYFETTDPSRGVKLIESVLTPEVKKYVASLAGVTNFVKQTYSLFATARQRRPSKLLVPKSTYSRDT